MNRALPRLIINCLWSIATNFDARACSFCRDRFMAAIRARKRKQALQEPDGGKARPSVRAVEMSQRFGWQSRRAADRAPYPMSFPTQGPHAGSRKRWEALRERRRRFWNYLRV